MQIASPSWKTSPSPNVEFISIQKLRASRQRMPRAPCTLRENLKALLNRDFVCRRCTNQIINQATYCHRDFRCALCAFLWLISPRALTDSLFLPEGLEYTLRSEWILLHA